MTTIADNLKRVLDDIADSAVRSGRDPSAVTLVAVSKTRTVDDIERVIDAGALHLGENRIQEAEEKIPRVRDEAVWHLVGHLQRNKVKRAVRLFDFVDSVDSVKLADVLSQESCALEKSLDVLIQVNISGEGTKSGISPDKVPKFLSYVSSCKNLRVRGLMTIGSLGVTEDVTRREFARMRALFERVRGDTAIDVLSMGMSGDFRIAIEEGSTMVRVGTAIFGPRR